MELARSHTPEQLNFYLLDFGTNGLLPLKDLPHVADTVTLGEDEKIRKMIVRINRLIKERQALLSEAAVANLAMYEEKTKQVIPDVVVIVDNFDSVGEMKFGEQFLNAVTKLAREGSSIGLHLVTTAATARALHNTLLNNIKQRLMLRQNNRDDIIELLGATKVPLEDIPGRALIKTDTAVRSFQVALPVDGETDLEVVNHLQEEVAQMNEDWTGERPEPIPMMKDQLTVDEFFNRKDVQQALATGKLPLGLDYEEVKPVVYDPDEAGNLLLIGNMKRKFVPLKRAIYSALSQLKVETKLMIDSDGSLPTGDNYFSTIEDLKQVKDTLLETVEYRQKNPTDGWMIVFVTDILKFKEKSGLTDMELQTVIKQSIDAHIALIAGIDNTDLRADITMSNLSKQYMNSLVITMRKQDQTVIDTSYSQNEVEPDVGDVWVEFDRQFVKTKIIDD